MKQLYNKVSHAFMAVLLLVSVFVPLLKLTPKAHADELAADKYALLTNVTINNNPLQSTGYGEGKFYINPTYTFADDLTLKDGDSLVYQVPKEFKIERAATEPITAPNGEVIGSLTTDPATNKATLTVTNAAYFARLTEHKTMSALFTVVWADDMPYNQERAVHFPGGGTYNLKRIKVDEEPQGYSKWGVQDSKDPNYVNWRIRVNRDVKNLGNVVIEDSIPDGQVLDTTTGISGYHFTDWEGASNGVSSSRTSFKPADVVSIQDTNHFTVNAGDLNGRGIYVIYRTRLTKPVDKVEKKAFNDIVVTAGGQQMPALAARPFAPLTTVDGIGEATQSDEVAFKVKKELTGRALADDEFTFDLLNADNNNQVVETVTNKNGEVTFSKLKFSNPGTFNYIIRERASNLLGVTNDPNSDINVTVTVTNQGGAEVASVAYSREQFTNSYQAPSTSATITAKKVLNGKAIEANKYFFRLTEIGGNNIDLGAPSDADGNVSFPALYYTEVGTHRYTITEVAGQEPGVTYDNAEHTVTVEVVNDNGQLKATVTGNNPTFTNIYRDYGVTYRFATLDATPLPDAVKALLPADAGRYTAGTEVTGIQPSQTSVKTDEGTWDFQGYRPSDKQTVVDKNLQFTGIWQLTPAPKYKAHYNFVSDSDKALPAEVTALLPQDAAEYKDGASVTAAAPAQTSVVTAEGTWTFKGYDATSKTIAGADVTFTGTWSFTAASKYKASYQFTSTDPNHSLPAEVTALLPTDGAEYADGATVTAIQPAQTTVKTADGGTWTFKGYDATSKTVAGADVTFTGTWSFDPTGGVQPPKPGENDNPGGGQGQNDRPGGQHQAGDQPGGGQTRRLQETKKVLPRTGSQVSFLAVAAGAALMGLALMLYRRKKN